MEKLENKSITKQIIFSENYILISIFLSISIMKKDSKFSNMPIFQHHSHIFKFLKCGLPKLEDYPSFDYDIIESKNPTEWELSKEYNKKQIPLRFQAQMVVMRTASYIVIKDDKILFEEYWLNYTKESKLNSFSASKSIVALLIGVAIQEKKIQSINQKVSDFLPEFSKGDNNLLRIIDLLSMSSGLNWSEDFANLFSDIVVAYYGTSIEKLMKKTQVEEIPGKKWSYQCGNTIVLAMLLEKATGVKITNYLEEKLWTPLGATQSAYWGKDKPNGITKSFCCLYATPRDFARLGLLVLNKGKHNNKQIVPAEYIKTITQPADWLLYKRKLVDFYGLHFWLADFKNKKIPYFSGLLGQYIFVLPEQNAVVVRFGEMINELSIMPLPPDVPLYLKVANKLL